MVWRSSRALDYIVYSFRHSVCKTRENKGGDWLKAGDALVDFARPLKELYISPSGIDGIDESGSF